MYDMNKNLNHIIYKQASIVVLLCMSVTLTSCFDDLASYLTKTPVRLTANAEEQKTRAHRETGDVLDIQNTAFDEGAEIAVYIKDADGYSIADGSGNPHWPAIFTADEVNASTHLNLLDHTPQLYYPTENKSVSIHAFYPKTVDAKETTGTALKTETTFSVATDQTSVDAYKNSDLMFAKIANQPRTSGNVNLNFAHKMVKFVFNVAGDGDVTINNCYLYQVATTIGVNPDTGELTQLSGAEANPQNVLLDNGGAVIIPPQTLSGTFIVVRGSARKEGQLDLTDAEARFSLKVENGALTNRVLQSGKVYTVNLTVGYDNFNKTYEIGTWDDQAGVISVAALGSTGFSIDNTTIDQNGYDYTGNQIVIPGLKVMYGSLQLTEGTHYELQYFNNVHAGKATVLAIGKGTYEGYAVAASFTINQIASTLQYTEVDGKTDKTSLSVEYARNYTINPTAETPKDIHLNIVGNGTMTYSISRVDNDNTTVVDNVATIVSGTGVITLKGTGTVKVTANMADDKDYLSSSDSFILTVTNRVYDEKNGNLVAYFVGNTDAQQAAEPPTSETTLNYTYNGQVHQPLVGVWDKVDNNTWVNITSSCTITYPDGAINAGEQRVNIALNSPYQGTIIKTYTIAKATPNLQIYEGGTTSTNLLSPQTLPLYLASVNTTNTSTCSRTRIAVTDFGTATFRIKPNTGTNSIFGVTESSATGSANTTSGYNKNTTGVFKASGTSTGTVTYQAYVEGTGNYNEAIVEFQVNVVTGFTEYTYTGYTQRWECPADGEYLLEVWGAQGGWTNSPSGNDFYAGGPGAKVQGKIKLRKGEKLFVNVGQAGITVTKDYNNFTCKATQSYGSSWTNGAEPNAGQHLDYDAYDDPRVNYANSPYLPWRTTEITASEVPVQGGDVGMETDTDDQKIIKVGFAWNGGGGQVWGLRHHNTYSPAPNYRNHWWDVRDPLSGGGGATDISLGWKNYNATTSDADANKNWYTAEHLLTRIIVAGGGSGACYYSNEQGHMAGVSGGGGDGGANSISGNNLVGFGSRYASGNTDAGQGGRLDRGGYGAVHATGGYDAIDVARGWADNTTARRTNRNVLTTPHNAQPSGWSGTDGIFGEGGWYYCVEEGNGAGGGGWYGGGSAGQSGANGVGGGGSSYVWCSTLETYYPTATDLWNVGKNYTPTSYSGTGHVAASDRHYYQVFNGSTVKTPSQNSYRYLYDCTSTANARSGDSSHSVDGLAHITCLSTVNAVDLGTRTYSPNN